MSVAGYVNRMKEYTEGCPLDAKVERRYVCRDGRLVRIGNRGNVGGAALRINIRRNLDGACASGVTPVLLIPKRNGMGPGVRLWR